LTIAERVAGKVVSALLATASLSCNSGCPDEGPFCDPARGGVGLGIYFDGDEELAATVIVPGPYEVDVVCDRLCEIVRDNYTRGEHGAEVLRRELWLFDVGHPELCTGPERLHLTVESAQGVVFEGEVELDYDGRPIVDGCQSIETEEIRVSELLD
jgi:hypothetical protein